MKALALLLAAALAAGGAGANGQAPAAASAKPKDGASLPEFGIPGDVPVAQLWTDFFAHADEKSAFKEALVADDLFPGEDGVDAAKCKSRRDELDLAARHVPVSFAIWFVRDACALALGDTRRADESERAMAALTRNAFAGLPPDHGLSAIRIFVLDDAYALAKASGDKLIYDFFDLTDRRNGIPLILGLRDPKTGRDRELRFDFVSSIVAIRRESDDEHYPDELSNVAHATIRSAAKDAPGTSLSDAQALFDTLKEDQPARMDDTIKLARTGSYMAAMLTSRCLIEKDSKCAQQAVDVLLPLAEKGFARPMLLLAVAYSNGRGVKQDPEAAKTLIKGAAKRIGDSDAYAGYAALRDVDGQTSPIDDWVIAGVERSADGGDPFAAQIAAAGSNLRHHEKDPHLNARERTWLESAEQKGLQGAASMLVEEAWRNKDAAQFSRYALKWADRQVDVAATLAAAYEDGSIAGIPRDATLALKWHRQAGMLGDSWSMRVVGAHYMSLGTPDSESKGVRWLYSSAATGSLGGTLDLAYALTNTPSLGPDALKHGVEIYRQVLADEDSARARRAFAKLLMDGHGVDKDIVQARKLLLQDAEKGDADSQLALARALRQNKLGKSEPAEIWGWVRKADAGGNRSASRWLAQAMFDGVDGMPMDRRKALDMFGKLTDAGDTTAANDYAWYLCVGPDASLRDPAKGLTTITKINLNLAVSTQLDTQASCLAATSDFVHAVDYQQRAIAGLPPDSGATLTGMQSRLELFRSGRPYVLGTAAAADPASSATVIK